MGTEMDLLAVGNYLLNKEEQDETLKENYEALYELIKVIGLNIFITFGLLGILLLAPPIFYQSYSFMAGESEGSGSADKRHELLI